MEREGLDWYAVAHTDNVYYLTNFAYIPFERPFFLLLPAAGKPVLVLPLLEVDHARQRVLIDVEYHAYYEYPAPPGRDYASALKEVIGPEERVGIESSLSLALREVIPGKLRVVDLVDEARMVKSDYEVGRIAHASMVVDQGMGKALELSRPGVPVLAIYSEGTREMQARLIMDIPQANFTVSRFLCAVWPGALSAQPHAVPGIFDLLEAGGPHVIIVTGQVDGYSAEVERTFFLGKVPEWAKGPFEVIMEARKLAFDAVKPGVPAAEVDRAVLELIERRGYGDYVLHRTGHGFGITGHEPPWIALGSKDFLQKNMVISVEPGIYIPDKGGFRHSDTVLVTSDGCLSLTRSPDRLEDLVLIL
jgi:Xaa-Pro dipeptidase